jgi:hypothetical protein
MKIFSMLRDKKPNKAITKKIVHIIDENVCMEKRKNERTGLILIKSHYERM